MLNSPPLREDPSLDHQEPGNKNLSERWTGTVREEREEMRDEHAGPGHQVYLGVGVLPAVYGGRPGGGGRSLVLTGGRRRVRSLSSLTSLVRRRRILPWTRVRGTVGGSRGGRRRPVRGRGSGPWVSLITNNKQSISPDKTSCRQRLESKPDGQN